MHTSRKHDLCQRDAVQVGEAVIDPQRPIIDAHFHFVHASEFFYEIEEYRRDISSGHNIVKSIFIECSQEFERGYQPHLKPVGETEYAADLAATARKEAGVCVAGIVARANLTVGDKLSDVLNAHLEAANGLLRGVRQIAAWDPNPDALSLPSKYFAAADLYEQAAFREGLRKLGQMGLSFDAWHYHHQLGSFIELASAVGDTLLILDHFGTPLGVGPYRGKQDEIFGQWRRNISELARRPNVFAKLGGFAMPDNGFGWDSSRRSPTSDEIIAAQGKYYHHVIQSFGPDRCMFESNFPVDRRSVSYENLFNAFKKIARHYSIDEQDMLFYGTAQRVYQLS